MASLMSKSYTELYDILSGILSEEKLNIDYKGNNEHIKENQLPKRFNESYNVLIVSEKYQTGFDEPLLNTMFVD